MRFLFALFLLCSCAAALASPPSKSSTCTMPVGLMVNSVTTNTASFSWQGNAEHLSYTLYYRRAGLANWNGASPTTDTAQTIGGLEPGTVYEAYVMAQCSSGAAPSPAITFSTASFWNENDYGDFYSGSYTSRVGIGTAIPMTRLHLIGGFLAEGNGGGTPAQGPGTRLMWVPNRAALRAGSVSGPLWDADSIGVGSLALGTDAAATDSHSVAIGHNVRATASNSMAFGFGGKDSTNQPVAGVNDEAGSISFFAGGKDPVMKISKGVTPPGPKGPFNPPFEGPPTIGNCDEKYANRNRVETWGDLQVHGYLKLSRRNHPGSSFVFSGASPAGQGLGARSS